MKIRDIALFLLAAYVGTLLGLGCKVKDNSEQAQEHLGSGTVCDELYKGRGLCIKNGVTYTCTVSGPYDNRQVACVAGRCYVEEPQYNHKGQ